MSVPMLANLSAVLSESGDVYHGDMAAVLEESKRFGRPVLASRCKAVALALAALVREGKVSATDAAHVAAAARSLSLAASSATAPTVIL